EVYRHFRFIDHLEENRFSDVGFESPGFILAIFFSKTAIELARDSADCCFVADIRLAESASSHSAKVIAEFQQDSLFAEPGRLHWGDPAARRAAVDANVCFDDLLRKGSDGGEQEKKERDDASRARTFCPRVRFPLTMNLRTRMSALHKRHVIWFRQ